MMERLIRFLVFLLGVNGGIVIIFSRSANAKSHGACWINVRQDFANNGPLVLSSEDSRILYPKVDNPSILSFESNETARICCPGTFVTISNVTKKFSVEKIHCVNGTNFSIDGRTEQFANIACKSSPKAKVVKTKKNCASDGLIYNIGFQIDKDDFLTNIELCHSSKLANTYWAHGVVVSTIGSKPVKHRKNDFGTGNVFVSVPVKQAYRIKEQYQTFMYLFNNEAMVRQYISLNESEKFFAKGHLVANADEFYAAQQDSTFFFANVVPMWQAVNNGNWKHIEDFVRRLATNKKANLDVWTGSFGVLTLPDKNGNEVSIYLINTKSDDQVIPVPKILFKYVHEPISNTGIVFLTANNPYIKNKDGYVICKEYTACDALIRTYQKFSKGYSYCCTVQDFLESEIVKKYKLPEFGDVKPIVP